MKSYLFFMVMKVLLVSDTHISNYIEAKELGRFLYTVCQRETVERIILLGDIFDFIFLYRGKYFNPDYIPLYRVIWTLEESGVAFDFFSGNHDIWITEVFKDHFNLSLHPEPYKVLGVNGENFLFSHGDRIIITRGYKMLQKILRSKINILIFSLLPPWFGDKVASLISHSSRKVNCQPDFEFVSKLKNRISEIAIKNRCSKAFCGHTHIAEVANVNGVVYGNPGSWMQDKSYIIIDDDNKIKQKKFSNKLALKKSKINQGE